MSLLQTLTIVLLLQGTLAQDPDVRIIGGSDCKEGEFPFMASLSVFEYHICGCTIIDSSWVLTASHCVDFYPIETLQIYYGSVRRNSSDVKPVAVSKIVMHPEYQHRSPLPRNDIALLKVEPEITLSERVQVVKLPEVGAPTPGNQMGVAIGWGLTSRNSSNTSKILQKIEMPILTEEECKNMYGIYFNPTFFCAGTGDPELDEDAFSGDSGGPILVSDVQVGIASFVDTRAHKPPYFPTGFTKVSLYIDWITETVNVN